MIGLEILNYWAKWTAMGGKCSDVIDFCLLNDKQNPMLLINVETHCQSAEDSGISFSTLPEGERGYLTQMC